MRWISLVPSKIVKIVDYVAVSAGQRPVGGRGISTDSAPAVRGWRLSPAAPRTLSSAVRCLAFLIRVAYALITSTSRRPGWDPDPQPGNAARILDGRLARGEIDADTYCPTW